MYNLRHVISVFVLPIQISSAVAHYKSEHVVANIRHFPTSALAKSTSNKMQTLRTPFNQEIPRAFSYQDRNGKKQFGGENLQLLTDFARLHGMQLELVPLLDYNIAQVEGDIEKGIYNLSVHRSTFYNPLANITFSYPLEKSKICIIVPAEAELPRYWYLVWPFDVYIWLLYILAVPYVALCLSCVRKSKRNFGANCLASWAILLFNSNCHLRLVNSSTHLQVVFILSIFLAFILNGYYICYLTSYNMRPVFQPYLSTVPALIEANMEILTPKHISTELDNNPHVDLSSVHALMVNASYRDVAKLLSSQTRSNAFIVTHDDWLFLEKIQRHLIQPVYQITDICFCDIFISYPVRRDSSFAAALDFFILLVHESGLWQQWQERAFQALTNSKQFQVLKDSYPVNPLDVFYYRIGWILFGFGHLVAAICFVGEILIFRWKK